MGNYVIPVPDAVNDYRSSYALPVWKYLTDSVGVEGEIHQPRIAEAVDCSVRTVQRILEGFKRCNLIDWESYQGQGGGIKVINLWLQKAEEIKNKLAWKRGFASENRYLKNPYSGESQLGTTRLDCLGIPNGVLTKGNKIYKYFAMKFRQTVENSTLSEGSHDIVSTILNYLMGKPREIAREWLIYLQNWLDEQHKYVGEFFKYFYDTLTKLAEVKLQTIHQQSKIEEMMERREEIQDEYRNNPPPRSSDFAQFSDYLKALEEWEGDSNWKGDKSEP
ncbi:hypothetical protein KGY71_00165 [Candidatus Bipolaricaulota bacterium]|nr:hypothetical protein [Candidatus Bipolaricaulota bacterium]MBS3792400.1 hypothetical protein [Candidatus Bipolaricaulota bacterium]